MENLKVIIIGAGMGGLTAGLALGQLGHEVTIYDQVRDLRPRGAGISLWSNGVKVLNRLGLGKAVAAIGGPMQQVAYFDHQGRALTDFSLEPLITQVGQCPYPVSRSALQAMLIAAVGPERVQLGARCVGIELVPSEMQIKAPSEIQPESPSESVAVVFEDDSRVTGDLVIGADGAHSVVREFVLGRRVERRYVGYVNWNGLVTGDLALGPSPYHWTTYVGNGQRAATMPVGDGLFYFFLDVPLGPEASGIRVSGGPATQTMPGSQVSLPDLRSDLRSELAHYFADWAEPVQRLIAGLDPAQTNRIAIHDLDPLDRWVQGRVALLGDAAHNMSPDVGQGGCQALEDAWVLANSLAVHNQGVEDALRRYEAARIDRVNAVLHQARRRCDLTHGMDPAVTAQWYRELAQEDGSGIRRAIAQTITAGPLG